MADKPKQRKGLRVARDDERQDLGETFADIGRQLGNALGDLAFLASAQGAIGWMLQDNPDGALQALQAMTDEQAAAIADAAERLAALIREDRA